MSPIRDFKIDPLTGDISVKDGDFEVVRDREAVVQGIAVRVKMFLGEVYYDLDIGVPWVQRILGKGPNHASDAEIQAILKDTIASTPDVTSVLSVGLTKKADRTMQLDYEATDTYLQTPFTGSVTVP